MSARSRIAPYLRNRYVQNNPEAVANAQQWMLDNPDYLQQGQQWLQNHPDARQQAQLRGQQWLQNHPDARQQALLRGQQYMQNNPNATLPVDMNGNVVAEPVPVSNPYAQQFVQNHPNAPQRAQQFVQGRQNNSNAQRPPFDPQQLQQRIQNRLQGSLGFIPGPYGAQAVDGSVPEVYEEELDQVHFHRFPNAGEGSRFPRNPIYQATDRPSTVPVTTELNEEQNIQTEYPNRPDSRKVVNKALQRMMVQPYLTGQENYCQCGSCQSLGMGCQPCQPCRPFNF